MLRHLKPETEDIGRPGVSEKAAAGEPYKAAGGEQIVVVMCVGARSGLPC
jgi:hypothetical protein